MSLRTYFFSRERVGIWALYITVVPTMVEMFHYSEIILRLRIVSQDICRCPVDKR